MAAVRVCRVLVLACACALWEAKSVHEHFEVQIKVQVFDNSDLSPLADALVEVHGNQSALATARAGADGTARVDFDYRAASWVIISAAKANYVTNSVPWYSGRPPLYASVSLYLLVHRPGTLILYDDVLQVLSGSPGGGERAVAQLPRKSLHLPPDSNGTALTASLTAARTRDEMGGFPFLLARETNGSGEESGWTGLTPLALVGLELSDEDGRPVPVSDPVRVSVPLPSDTRNRVATSVPTWTYRRRWGVWVRNGTGYIQKEGSHFVWKAVLPQTGYWLAAFPTSSGLGPGHPGLSDIGTYHALFLLAVLGSLALLVLILLCVLLYYCRRRCLKPRRQLGKPLPSNGAKRDQGTSTSRLNLICGPLVESGPSGDRSEPSPSRDYRSSGEDLPEHAAARKLRRAAGKSENLAVNAAASSSNNLDNPLLRQDYERGGYSPAEGGESDYRRHRGANDNGGYSSDPPSPPPFRGYLPSQPDKPPEYSAAPPDGLARPTSLNTHPGQIIFCGSIDQMKENMYRSMVPTLVIPAHYMRLPSGADPKDGDKDGVTAGGARHEPPQQHQGGPRRDEPEDPSWASDASGGAVAIPVLFDGSTMAQMNGELQALTEKKLLELGVKQHPRAWFISLDGRANAHVRHSYIDAGANDLGGGGPGSSPRDANLEAPECKSKDQRWEAGRKGHGGAGKSYSKLAYPDPPAGEGRPASPEENSLTPLLDQGASAVPRKGRDGDNRRCSGPDDEDKEENRKSPWQKIEDRPLMVFHPRK
ncbi:protein FAM171A2 [Syngnathus scovelli]|uniref:protein FAM171A2 n=1 Tax=Syngnathus scovelli TaxID=161590 RepID=UPI002110DABB|nr:protein FAM171A2 [Syngnathus scovelli]